MHTSHALTRRSSTALNAKAAPLHRRCALRVRCYTGSHSGVATPERSLQSVEEDARIDSTPSGIISVNTRARSSSRTRNLAPLAHEFMQGALAKWTVSAPGQAPPTAVLVHGILGSKRNLQRFARMLIERFPSWQVLLIDLRCHGESATLSANVTGPHNVATASADVLQLLNQLKLFPTMLIGHSFGGKVVMSMVQQFGGASGALPKPVQVWALDALPGEVRAGSGKQGERDHPSALLEALISVPMPVTSRGEVVNHLLRRGFSTDISHWAATNLRPLKASFIDSGDDEWAVQAKQATDSYEWGVDLLGISDMYSSYEDTSLWPLLESPPQGLQLDFVRAELSNFRWGQEAERIESLGHGVHLLRGAGHWVHTDQPQGLLDILAPSLGAQAGMERQQRRGSGGGLR